MRVCVTLNALLSTILHLYWLVVSPVCCDVWSGSNVLSNKLCDRVKISWGFHSIKATKGFLKHLCVHLMKQICSHFDQYFNQYHINVQIYPACFLWSKGIVYTCLHAKCNSVDIWEHETCPLSICCEMYLKSIYNIVTVPSEVCGNNTYRAKVGNQNKQTCLFTITHLHVSVRCKLHCINKWSNFNWPAW